MVPHVKLVRESNGPKVPDLRVSEGLTTIDKPEPPDSTDLVASKMLVFIDRNDFVKFTINPLLLMILQKILLGVGSRSFAKERLPIFQLGSIDRTGMWKVGERLVTACVTDNGAIGVCTQPAADISVVIADAGFVCPELHQLSDSAWRVRDKLVGHLNLITQEKPKKYNRATCYDNIKKSTSFKSVRRRGKWAKAAVNVHMRWKAATKAAPVMREEVIEQADRRAAP
ncbi:hypothetical protein Scep_030040 [Stephania cephalantha]|uniref:Uncharacterized protein n=1 Tax=Stephania cephalantha TaxID=152367 RepID=A0AAP0DYT7_9MAGN